METIYKQIKQQKTITPQKCSTSSQVWNEQYRFELKHAEWLLTGSHLYCRLHGHKYIQFVVALLPELSNMTPEI